MADAGLSSGTLLVSGALTMGYAVAALFFAKFRQRTRSGIFAWFTAAFVLLAVQRVLLVTITPHAPGTVPWSYALRLLAFVLILVGIALENRPRPRTR